MSDAEERRTFWTAVMRDERADMRNRLKASELLARVSGDFIKRCEAGEVTLRLIREVVHTRGGSDHTQAD